MYETTMTVPTWKDMPATVKGDCMARLGPGLYGHHRLSTVFVVLDETTPALDGTEVADLLDQAGDELTPYGGSVTAAERLADEVAARHGAIR